MTYRGVWQEGTYYQPSDYVTFGGAFWVCKRFTTSKPGTEDDAWKLSPRRHDRG